MYIYIYIYIYKRSPPICYPGKLKPIALCSHSYGTLIFFVLKLGGVIDIYIYTYIYIYIYREREREYKVKYKTQ